MRFRSWLRCLRSAINPAPARDSGHESRKRPRRSLFLEILEDRTVPSIYVVTTTADTNANPTADPNQGPVSLRDAISAVNSDAGDSAANPDQIQFAIPASDPNHVYYQNSIGNVATTTASDDSTIADISQAWPHSWWSIQPSSPLPAVTAPVTINGYTQTGASGNTLAAGDNAVVRIELNGSSAGADAIGLTVPGNSSVEGMVVNSFSAYGVNLYGQGGDVVQGNFIGTDVSGTLAMGNALDGMNVNSNNNLIGGATPGARNIVSGTTQTGDEYGYGDGISISNAGITGNLVEGNLVGTDASGETALGNISAGVFVGYGATNNTIGGSTVGSGNVISGNGLFGVQILNGSSNYVEGNLIGTDVTGTRPLGNITATLPGQGHNGVQVYGAADGLSLGNVIGTYLLSNGQLAGAGNVISGQTGNATGIGLGGASQTQVCGNFIGTDVTGTKEVPNFIGINVSSSNNVIGGPGGLGNLISGNHSHIYSVGIQLASSASGNVVQGNLVGTDVSGTQTLPNSNGIADFGINTTIGGLAPGTGNVIAGSDFYGNLQLGGTGALVEGNMIGTDASGTLQLGGGGILIRANNNTIGGTTLAARNTIAYSGSDGIQLIDSASDNTIAGNFIHDNAGSGVNLTDLDHYGQIIAGGSNNTIGGTTLGAGNVIADNGGSGVLVDAGTGNTIRGNSIHDNGGLGIALNSANNANNDQAFPILTAVSISSNGTTIMGTLHSAANTLFDLELFSNAGPDPSGFGEGQTLLGVLHNLATDANGDATFTTTVAAPPAGQGFVTATATNLTTGDTSQFAKDFITSSLSGVVFQDFNNDGQVDFGEPGIAGVSIHLTGTDILGNTVDVSQATDADGAYVFLNLMPGSYTIAETQPAGYSQGIDSVGTAGGSLVAIDTFAVQLGSGVNGLNYNFGERPPSSGPIQPGQTATIGFWNNNNGQALINALPIVTNADGSVTSVANWLAATLPHMFGSYAGSNNLAGQSNAEVAGLFQNDFVLKGIKLDAQVLATALSVFATNASLDSTAVAAQYGFTVSGDGVGTATVNVGSNGDAFAVADNTTMTVLDLLLHTDAQAVNGVLYGGDITRRTHANNVYSALNQAGDIG